MPNEFIYNPPLEPFLEILHNDDAIIVVNKPAGLLSVPGRDPRHNDSIVSRVRRDAPEAQAVHRLDMATSGIMAEVLAEESASGMPRIGISPVEATPACTAGVALAMIRSTPAETKPFMMVLQVLESPEAF